MSGVFLGQVIPSQLFPGAHRIRVTVDELGVVGSYRARLYSRQDGRLVQEVWSDSAGAAAFNNIAYIAQGYYACAFDHSAPLVNAAISDLITPEPMP